MNNTVLIATEKRTVITSNNISSDIVKTACKNTCGIIMENSYNVRNAVALHLDSVLAQLHAEAKANKTGFYKA